MTAVLLLAATGLLVTPPVGRATVGPRRAGKGQVQMMDMFGGLMQGFTKLAAGSYDEAEVRQALERQIKNRPCVVYSTTSCPFCKKTKDLLSSFGTRFTIVDFDEVIQATTTPHRAVMTSRLTAWRRLMTAWPNGPS